MSTHTAGTSTCIHRNRNVGTHSGDGHCSHHKEPRLLVLIRFILFLLGRGKPSAGRLSGSEQGGTGARLPQGLLSSFLFPFTHLGLVALFMVEKVVSAANFQVSGGMY